MGNDEDDFEYDDDDFDYDVGSESDGDDENIRQALELDDIKDRLQHDSSGARDQLECLAGCYTSAVCVEAALQLFRLNANAESFLRLAETIARAPESVDEYARSGAFEDAIRLLEQDTTQSREHIVEMCISAGSILRKIKPSRVYLRTVLKVADLLLLVGELREAWRVLDDDLEPALSSMNELAVPQFKFEELILRIRLCMVADPVRRQDLRLLVESASRVHQGARSVDGTIILQYAHGLLKIEAGALDEAKMLLTESFKGQSESDFASQGCTDNRNVPFMLILVSTVLGAGHFDPLLEIPLLANVSTDDLQLAAPLGIASAFKKREPESFMHLLHQLGQTFSNDGWRLGQGAIIKALKASFSALQFRHTLQTYSRIKWDTLVKLIGPQLNTRDSNFYCLALDDELPGTFKRNEIDKTIDRVPPIPDWRSASSVKPVTAPLPSRYREHANRETQKSQEDKILSKWRRDSSPPRQGVSPISLVGQQTPSEAVRARLLKCLDHHFEVTS